MSDAAAGLAGYDDESDSVVSDSADVADVAEESDGVVSEDVPVVDYSRDGAPAAADDGDDDDDERAEKEVLGDDDVGADEEDDDGEDLMETAMACVWRGGSAISSALPPLRSFPRFSLLWLLLQRL